MVEFSAGIITIRVQCAVGVFFRLMALPGSEDFEDDGEEEKPESTLNVSASTESSPKIRWKEDSELVAMVVFEKNEPLWDTVA